MPTCTFIVVDPPPVVLTWSNPIRSAIYYAYPDDNLYPQVQVEDIGPYAVPGLPLGPRVIRLDRIKDMSSARFAVKIIDITAPGIWWVVCPTQDVDYPEMEEGAVYYWSLASGKLEKLLPGIALALPEIKPQAAGESFELPFSVKETSGRPGQIKVLLGADELWKGNISGGQSLPLSFSTEMPFADLTKRLSVQGFQPLQKTWKELAAIFMQILVAFPFLQFTGMDFPEITAAGETFKSKLVLQNTGAKGTMRLLFAGTTLLESKVGNNEFLNLTLEQEMPFNDLTYDFQAQVLGMGKNWVETSHISVPVKAGFPDLQISGVSAPSLVMPGKDVTFSATLKNTGFIGNVQGSFLDIKRNETLVSDTVKLPSGAEMTLRFSGEMAPVEQWDIKLTPKWVGRNKETAHGAAQVVPISGEKAMFEYARGTIRFTGSEEAVEVFGVIVAEDIEFKGEFGGLAPQPVGGLMGTGFKLSLAAKRMDEITFKNLKYFKMTSDKSLAMVKDGQLASKESSTYESGTMASSLLTKASIFTTSLTRRSSKVESVV